MKFNHSSREPVSKPNSQMLRRTLFLMAVCGIFAFLLLLTRLYKIQIIDHEFYEQRAMSQQLRENKSSAARGSIYDRKMYPLALSAPVDNLYLSPGEIEARHEDRELIARGLSHILDLDYDEVYKKTSEKGSYYVTVKRKLSREESDEVRKFKTDNNLRGIRLEPDSKRYYPNSSLACHVLGFVGTDNQGLEGIEARYESVLGGTEGRTLRLTNAYGTDLLFKQFEEHCPGEEGLSLVLSLDSGVQYFVEKHLKQAVEDYDIQNGAGAIAMDVNTGGILAMASIGGFDPNNFLDVSDKARKRIDASDDPEGELRAQQLKQWRNKALSDSYEPGSTFKIITLSMALEEGAADLNSTYYCGGSVNVRGRTSPIRCWKHGGHGSQNLTQAVQHSCNAAFVNIGLQIGAERFYDYLEAFGFLEKTGNKDDNLTAKSGIDLSGETGSIFWSENVFCSPKNLSQLAAASFGQTFTISPLQLITAVSACVNGGKLMQPYVVEKMLNEDGTVAYERKPQEVRRVISEETSAKVRQILEAVVGDPKEGTGRNAAVRGYRIGGKTGTSEKVNLEATTGKKEYIVSFIGFAPADDPKIALLVFLDTPSDKSGIYVSGGQMAAPTVGKMFADILPYMGFVPHFEEEEINEAEVPDLVEMSISEGENALYGSELRYRVIGEGDVINAQLPKAGSKIAKNSEVIIYAGQTPTENMVTLPELKGMGFDEARDCLARNGIYVRSLSPLSDGETQKIVSQSLPAGTEVPKGSVIELMLRDSDKDQLGKY